jgi:hypothetical protein
LKIEGLTGDIWSAFGVRRLTISDEKGVWLDAADLASTGGRPSCSTAASTPTRSPRARSWCCAARP